MMYESKQRGCGGHSLWAMIIKTYIPYQNKFLITPLIDTKEVNSN